MNEMKRMFMIGATLATGCVLISGCERVRTWTSKIKDASHSPSPVSATFTSDQISMVDAGNYAAFTAQKDKLVIIDFYADWCGPCRELGPILEKATQAHPGVVFLGKVNVDKSGQLAADHQVSSIPDVRIYKNGRQIDQFIGIPGETEVMDKIAALAKDITPAVPVAPAGTVPASSAMPVGEPAMQPMQKDWLPKGMEKR